MTAHDSEPRELPTVSIKGLQKEFRRVDGTLVRPVDDISLDIADGEFLVLLGPSGCGKTTLLRCIAGLETPDAGEIHIFGRPAFSGEAQINEPAERRQLGMIFQSYALWPHMSVTQNVAYPLKARKVPRAEIRTRVADVLEAVGVAAVADQMPGQLSGGQQQRVALARALVTEASLLLFDEPLSNVDAKVRETLRAELVDMQHRLGFTAIYVTHDQGEAMELADRIAVLDNGRILQLGPPREIYERPVSHHVANFIGKANEVTGTVTSAAGSSQVEVKTSLGTFTGRAVGELSQGSEVRVMWRPERTVVSATPTGSANEFSAHLFTTVYMGVHEEHVFDVVDSPIRRMRVAMSVGHEVGSADNGSMWHLRIDPADVWVLPA